MRGKRAKKRTIVPDIRYGSSVVTLFINKVMLHGKKDKAEKIFYEALEESAKKSKVTPDEFLIQVLDNVRPTLEIRARRVGGANYQVPMPVSPRRQDTLAIRWIVDSCRGKSGSDFSKLLQKELLDAYDKTGEAVKKKDETERMAEANKAFAHFRW